MAIKKTAKPKTKGVPAFNGVKRFDEPGAMSFEEGKAYLGVHFLMHLAHKGAWGRGWHHDAKGALIKHNVGQRLMLIVSEISEAMEAHRRNAMDDKLVHRNGFEVELADALIRIFDTAAEHKLDLAGAVIEKMRFNAIRKDHARGARSGKGGKRY